MDWLSYLRVPEDKKTKDWYKSIIDSIAPNIELSSDRYKRLLGIYGILNNDLTYIQAELDKLCRPLGMQFDPFESNEKVVAYNRIFPKFQYHLGQMMSYGSNFSVIRMGDEGNRIWNEELRDHMRQSINERINLRIEQSDMYDAGATDGQLEAYYARMRSYEEPEAIDTTNFMSASERFNNRMLKYFAHKYNLENIKKKIFRHVLASDFGLVGIIHGTGSRPKPYVFNPLYFFHDKSADEELVQKGHYWGYHMPIRLAQAYDELTDVLTDDEMNSFLSSHGVATQIDFKEGFSKLELDFSRQRQIYDSQSQVSSADIGQHMSDQDGEKFGRTTIWKTHIEFKGYRRTLFITTMNEYGRSITEIVPHNFEIPPTATRVKGRSRYSDVMTTFYEWIDAFGQPAYAEYVSIPRRYEMDRYGHDLIVNFREVPNQPVSVDDPFDFELSAKGRNFTALNASPISLVERALNVFVQYLFVKHLQNKELAKYEGVIKSIDAAMIPDYLNTDENGQPLFQGVDKMAVWRYFRRKLGDSYFDSSMRTSGLQPQGSPGKPVSVETVDAIGQIINMQNLADLLDREMAIQMLVPPQAEGSFQPYSNASDNQMAVKAGSIMAETYYAETNDIVRAMLNEYLIQIRIYYVRFFEEHPGVEETFLNYVTPEGTREVLRITPEMLTNEDMGVFLQESHYARQYRDVISQHLQEITQNQGDGVEVLSQLVMSLARGDSPEDIHYKIQKVNREQEQRMAQMQQMQEKVRAEAMMRDQQAKERAQVVTHELAKDEITHEYAKKAELAAVGIWLGQGESKGSNDQDDIPGYIEALKAVREMNRKDEELSLKKEELAHRKDMDEKSLKKEVNATKNA